MSTKLDKKYLTKKVVEAVILFVVTLLAVSTFKFMIEPYVTEKPELEILVIEPKLVDGGELASFDITIENIGERTAADLYCYALEMDFGKANYSQYTRIETPFLVRKGENTHLMFNMRAPDEDDFKSAWNIRVILIYKFSQNNYFKQVDIIYEYSAESNRYHKISS